MRGVGGARLNHGAVSGLPAGGPTAGIFFTRWVTHFCAPTFVFLAGTGAFLYGRKLGDPGRLARYLVTRGLMLVLFELTVIRASWTFNFDYSEFVLAGVIWMLGWCMVLPGGLVRLRTRTIGIIGLVVILFQQLITLLRALPPSTRNVIGDLEFLYPGGGKRPQPAGGPSGSSCYVIIDAVDRRDGGRLRLRRHRGSRARRAPPALPAHRLVRDRAVRRVAAPRRSSRSAADDATPALFRFLNQQKYPASQPFLLMTLGPTIALLPLAERARGWMADFFATFGRVPMFYYLLHIPVIHSAALVVMRLREGSLHPEWYATAPFTSVPDGHQWRLPLLYLVFVIVIVLLYGPCRWYAGVKARRQEAWLRYL